MNVTTVIKTVVCCAVLLTFCSSSPAQPPAAVPPPEPSNTFDSSAMPINSADAAAASAAFSNDMTVKATTAISTGIQLSPPATAEDSLESSANGSRVAPSENPSQSQPVPISIPEMTLPDIVKCCRLSSITLRKASAAESLKNESLPLPTNKAALYLERKGVHRATTSYSVASLRQPQSVCFQPLYFEDPKMERCGTSYGIATEFVSAVRFFGRAPLIPYLVGSQNPHQCVRSLGDCNVCQGYGKTAYLPKLNPKGVAFQTAAVVGLVFLLP